MPATAPGRWQAPVRVPATAAGAAALSISCTAVGFCALGGSGFVDAEVDGVVGKAQVLAGTSGDDVSWSVSCRATNSCAAAGSADGAAYVATETDGVWGRARQVPGLTALDRRNGAVITSLSCGAGGDCATGGSAVDAAHATQAFLATSTGGLWHKAKAVPGLQALNRGGYAAVSAVSCASATSCSAGGLYSDGSGRQQAFVVDEVDGSWHKAEQVPGLAALNAGGYAQVSSLSCTSPGYCAAGGLYSDGGFNAVPFVVNEKHGVWANAHLVKGVNGFSPGAGAGIDQVSCSSAGNCAAGGFYTDSAGRQQAFVANEIDGVWRTGREVPASAAHNTGNSALVESVSCVATGDCTAGGVYTEASGRLVVFIASELDGSWGRLQPIGGLGDGDTLYALSCVALGNCDAVGGAFSGAGEAFVVSERTAKAR